MKFLVDAQLGGNRTSRTSTCSLLERNLSSITAAMEEARFIELVTGRLIVHDDQ